MSKHHGRMLVVGLDGACWDLLEPWILAGDLPVIQGLRAEGTWGPLESTIPPVTCPAWKAYSSGKNPGKFGVFWWQHVDISAQSIKIPNADSFHSEEVWDHLNRAGTRAGVMGMPMTYPPRDIDGFMIAGGPDCLSRGYARPIGLEELIRSWGYRVHPSIEGALDEGGPAVEQILKWIATQFDVAERLWARDPVSFLQITIYYVNWLQHRFYNGRPVREAWRLIDQRIGRLIKDFDHVVLLSDHGTARMRKTFFLNAWLQQHGYLRLNGRPSLAELLYRFGINKRHALNIARVLRVGDLVSRSDILRWLALRFLLDEEGLVSDRSGAGVVEGVDWEHTRVVALPQGPIYVNRSAVAGQGEYDRLRDRLIEEIEEISDPEGGRPITNVYRREDVYHGEYVGRAPDLVALDADDYHNRGGLGKLELFQRSGWTGNNSRYGLFLMRGPNVRRGARFERMKIYDVAPTILHLMRTGVPPGTDGRIAEEVLDR